MKHHPVTTAATAPFPGRLRPTALACALSLLLPMLATPALAQVRFVATEIVALPGSNDFADAHAVNASGTVAGVLWFDPVTGTRPFRWSGGAPNTLGSLTQASSLDINQSGVIAGTSGDFAFLARPGMAPISLGVLSGDLTSGATAINDAGTVVGYSDSATGPRRAFIWQESTGMTAITTSTLLTDPTPLDISNNGTIVGYDLGGSVPLVPSRAFVITGSTVTLLPSLLGGLETFATAIASTGWIVGRSDRRAVLWRTPTQVESLGTIPAGSTYVTKDVNALGQIVGFTNNSTVIQDPLAGFLWSESDGMVDLNDHLAIGSLATVLSANGLNEHGQIAATADYGLGPTAALLTPSGSLHWTGSAGGSFLDAAQWRPDLGFRPSNPYLDHVLASAVSQTITLGQTATARSVQVGGGTGVVTLQIGAGAQLQTSAGLAVTATGVLTGEGLVQGRVTNAGEVRAANLTIAGDLVNTGLVTGNGRVQAVSVVNEAAGRIRVDPGQRLVLGADLLNRGSVDVRAGELEVTGALRNSVGGRVGLVDSPLRAAGGIDNEGLIEITAGAVEITGAVVGRAGSRLVGSGGAQITFRDAVDIGTDAELSLFAGSSAVFLGRVTHRNGALFAGSGNKRYEGGLTIGDSPGRAFDEGDVSFGEGNVALFEIGGLVPGTRFDQYLVDGELSFGGTLQLVSWDGFTGEEGQRFDLFDWGSTSGRFDTIDARGLLLAPGLQLDTSRLYLDGTIAITAVPEPQTWALWLAGLAGLVAHRRRSARAPRSMSGPTTRTEPAGSADGVPAR